MSSIKEQVLLHQKAAGIAAIIDAENIQLDEMRSNEDIAYWEIFQKEAYVSSLYEQLIDIELEL